MNEIIYSQWQKYIDQLQVKFSIEGGWWLHILADFDRTLTKNFVKWKEKPSLVSVLRSEWILGEEYSQKAYKLYDTYHPIEVSPDASVAEKKQAMNIWWRTHMQLIVDAGLKKEHIQQAISAGIIEFREGIPELLGFLKEHNIPLVIISANAIGTDSIRSFLKIHHLDFDNIQIISNEFEWDDTGSAVWYNKNVIHTFNKDETVLENFPSIYNKIQERKNVILLWDSLWDPWMVKWFDTKNILKVWFLNKNKDTLEESYKKLYDVLVLNDGNMDFINNFLRKI